MTRRFLLVVGWFVAAAAVGTVASAAVSLAGGQVLDRALHPLTAAEVAALPVPTGHGAGAAAEHPASGATASTAPPREGGAGAADPGVSTDGPIGPAGVIEGTPVTPAPHEDRTPGGEAGFSGRATTLHLRGGSVALAADQGTVRLLWATPRQGYVGEVVAHGTGALAVGLLGGGRLYIVHGAIVDGTLRVATTSIR